MTEPTTEPRSLAEATRVTDPRKKPVPGATPFVPNVPSNAPEYEVVDQPYFDGKLHEIGELVRSDAPILKELGSPGRYLKPKGHTGQWPPKAYMEMRRRAEARAREEWIKDLRRG